VKTATELDHHGSWLHEAFLARAAEPGNERSRHALGAFLTMRLADRFDPADEPAHPLALAYQVRATRDYLTDLQPQNVEATHLVQVVRMADAVQQGSTRAILWPPLLAYANWLEQELRLGEALDVVETALRLNDGKAPTEEIAALLQRARILRLLGQLQDAKQMYELARVKAAARGDTHSQLLGRIGQAIVMRQAGNLSGSENVLRQILQDAEAAQDRDAQARAHHDLGVACNAMGRPGEAIPHLYRAFEAYEQTASKLAALSDLGESLKREGHYDGAKDAFDLVLHGRPTPQLRITTLIALHELSMLRGDRLTFERLGKELTQAVDDLPPERRADFEIQVGVGSKAFGHPRKAEHHFRAALAVAEEHGLHEYAFRAQAALDELGRTRTRSEPREQGSPRARHPEEVVAIAQKLHALAVA
jgi:tetratricopeptide (TPR) repeat protein